MTTFYDRKAERLAAGGQAQATKAEAALKLAEAQAILIAAKGKEAREASEDKRKAVDAKAKRRGQAVKAAQSWLAGHVVELALSVVVVVPAVMAWTAMASFGNEVFGPVGWGLPLFSEAAMWAFAFAAHTARKSETPRPTGWLQAGVWVFAAVAAVLNFIHGLTMRDGGVGDGLVMAVVAIGGVVAHQLITATPTRTRRSPAERREARTGRIAARRVTRMQRAAVRRAVGELAADGTVRLLHAPGTVTMRGRLRSRLVPATVPGLLPAAVDTEFDAELRALLNEAQEPAGTAETADAPGLEGTNGTHPDLLPHLTRVRQAITAGQLPARPSRRKVQAFLGIRAETAQDVIRALRDEGDGGSSATPVPA
ncbi:hypothetical protein SAMN05216215_103158 [Saccharopolyspora shandongensis]|uniref:DUF2637 domain-containing protein n=1 Tax=Saccharopolyspora shandongensis TaxID=418495 RepID=A0A1H3LG46_9PSEU|nr:hypothetical protein [Saccharopolyspora shandongensis]SDY63412.1 hypothetical protein SAMN05216215_103158 [Saccharopolyspora shandongensis]